MTLTLCPARPPCALTDAAQASTEYLASAIAAPIGPLSVPRSPNTSVDLLLVAEPPLPPPLLPHAASSRPAAATLAPRARRAWRVCVNAVRRRWCVLL